MGLKGKLLQLQTILENPGYDEKNPHFKNEYVSFPALRQHLIPKFNELDIVVEQDCVLTEQGWAVRTALTDNESGETAEYLFPLHKELRDQQQICGAFSYARRYSLIAVLTMVGEHDDDGNKASGIDSRPGSIPKRAFDRKAAPKPKPKPPVYGQVEGAVSIQQQLEETFDAVETPFPPDEEPPESDYLEEEEQQEKPKFTLTPAADRISEGQVRFLWMLNNWGIEKGDKAAREEAKTELNLYVQSMGWGDIEMIPWKKFREVYEQIPRWNPAAADKIAEVCAEDDARRKAKKK